MFNLKNKNCLLLKRKNKTRYIHLRYLPHDLEVNAYLLGSHLEVSIPVQCYIFTLLLFQSDLFPLPSECAFFGYLPHFDEIGLPMEQIKQTLEHVIDCFGNLLENKHQLLLK